MKKAHRNIPIFIPHLGCPNMCVFCNQRSISGKQSFDRESVRGEIDRALATIEVGAEVEIAYFGGSCTGIDRELMIYLLDVAQSYIDAPDADRARVTGIRMSTRPDYITPEIMEILSRYSVKTVELGLQSMDDVVLTKSGRGHTAADAERACAMIISAGYELVGQMMIGLPGSDLENEIMTAKKICDMGACGARIYPTVTFFGTELACMAGRGEYRMLELDDAIERSKEVLKIFEERGVECIRIGLCASDNLGDLTHVMGGANHPALGELVRGELYFERMCRLADQSGARKMSDGTLIFTVPQGELSVAIGQKRKNIARLCEIYKPLKIKICEANIQNLALSISER
jgi:histone acetyltransferase (RNA polymerase elongator complex component)